MPNGFRWTVKVNARALRDRPAWVQAGLEAGGLAFMAEMRDYPPDPPIGDGLRGTYRRTMTLGAKAQYEVQGWRRVEFSFGGGAEGDGTPLSKIFTYLMQGTGIYGPEARPITAASGGLLAWPVTNSGHPAFGKFVFARSVRGSIWEGKLQAIREHIIDAVQTKLKDTSSAPD